MVNQEKITEKTGQLASKAAQLGGQAKQRATHVAGEVVSRAVPLAGQAKHKATELAHKAGPMAAHGVETTAAKLDQLTHGKYSGRIKSVSTTLEHLLDRGGNGRAEPSDGPVAAAAPQQPPQQPEKSPGPSGTSSRRRAASPGQREKG